MTPICLTFISRLPFMTVKLEVNQISKMIEVLITFERQTIKKSESSSISHLSNHVNQDIIDKSDSLD